MFISYYNHEDIDALFGVFSKYLRLQDVYTFDGGIASYEYCWKIRSLAMDNFRNIEHLIS